MQVEAMRQEELSSFNKYKDEFKVVFDVGARGNTEFIDIHPNCEYHLFEPQKEYVDHLLFRPGERMKSNWISRSSIARPGETSIMPSKRIVWSLPARIGRLAGKPACRRDWRLFLGRAQAVEFTIEDQVINDLQTSRKEEGQTQQRRVSQKNPGEDR